MNLDLNTLSDNPFDLLGLNTNSQANQTNKSILTFLSKNFMCFNFSYTDFLILSIINNLIKETNISRQQYASDLFSISCKYLLNNKIKSFYQIEKGENLNAENTNNNNNVTNQSIKINNLNSANTSMHNIFNSPPKADILNNNNNNNHGNNKNLIYSESKLPYFISLILSILNNFLENPSSERNANFNFNKQNKLWNNNYNDKSNIINSLKSSLAANYFTINNNNNNNLSEINKFNPMDGEIFELFYNLIEKSFYFMQEILLTSEKETLGKIIKANSPDFTENDFNEKLFKFFIKAEIMSLNDIINFIQKILFFKKTEKTLKNRIIYFFFENLEKILICKNTANSKININVGNDNNDNKFVYNEETFAKNLFFKDENFSISILVLITEALNEQFNSKAEEYFSQLHNILAFSKAFFGLISRNRDNVLKISQMHKVSFIIEKGNKLVSALEEKLRQKVLMDKSMDKLMQEEKSKNG